MNVYENIFLDVCVTCACTYRLKYIHLKYEIMRVFMVYGCCVRDRMFLFWLPLNAPEHQIYATLTFSLRKTS